MFFSKLFIEVLFALFIGLVSNDKSNEFNGTYEILDSSILRLHGTTNVNAFTCDCEQGFNSSPLSFITTNEGKTWNFSRAQLNVNVKAFNCGIKALNRDLAKTLKADEYPHIGINVLEACQLMDCFVVDDNECLTAKTQVIVNLAGVSKMVDMDVDCYFREGSDFHFLAHKTLNMCDFNIEPPTAFLGMVQVDEKIVIDLDLKVRLNDRSNI
jgi:hypothetical protein